MTSDPRAEAGFTGPQGLELATTFARAIHTLALADTDDAVLRAIASVVSAYGPSLIRLYSLRDDPGDPGSHDPRFLDRSGPRVPKVGRQPDLAPVPTHAELSSTWQAGVCPAEDPLLGRPFALADHPVLARWLAAPTHPLVLHDLAADPRPGAHPGERSAQALVVLPLATASAGPDVRWPGLLVLSWKIVHIPSARERLVYDLLGRAVGSLLAARDDLRDHQRALDEASTVHVAALTLAEAGDLDDILSALSEPAQAIDASSAALWLRDPEGPARLVLRARGDADEPPAERPAVRPLAGLAGLFDRSNEPCLFGQVRTDSAAALEADAPAPAAGATLVLPLAWGGREVALLELGWSTPRPLPPGLRRLYAALAGPAAVTLAGRVLLAEAIAAAADPDPARLDAVAAAAVVFGPDGLRGNAAFTALGLGEGPIAGVLGEASAGADVVRIDFDLDLDGPEAGPASLAVFAGPGGPGRSVAVLLNITADAARERARLAGRDALLDRQATLQARRAVPVIDLADAVAVVPVLGNLDEARAQQLTDVIAQVPRGPRTIILDFTGVRAVEPEVAAEVHAAARALVAGGASVTLAGVPPALTDALANERADTLGDALTSALSVRP